MTNLWQYAFCHTFIFISFFFLSTYELFVVLIIILYIISKWEPYFCDRSCLVILNDHQSIIQEELYWLEIKIFSLIFEETINSKMRILDRFSKINNLSVYATNEVDIKNAWHNKNMTYNITIIVIRYYNMISKLIYIFIL